MSEIQPIIMPKWGLAMEEGTLTAWLVQDRSQIEKGQEIAEIETTKIANVYESPVSGTLRRIVAKPGDVVPVGALLAVLAPASVSDSEIDGFVAGFVVEASTDLDAAAGSVAERRMERNGRHFGLQNGRARKARRRPSYSSMALAAIPTIGCSTSRRLRGIARSMRLTFRAMANQPRPWRAETSASSPTRLSTCFMRWGRRRPISSGIRSAQRSLSECWRIAPNELPRSSASRRPVWTTGFVLITSMASSRPRNART